jgi:hypothetical protein
MLPSAINSTYDEAQRCTPPQRWPRRQQSQHTDDRERGCIRPCWVMDDSVHVAGSLGRSDEVLAAEAAKGLLAKWTLCHGHWHGCPKLRVWNSTASLSSTMRAPSSYLSLSCATMMGTIPQSSHRGQTGRMGSAARLLTGLCPRITYWFRKGRSQGIAEQTGVALTLRCVRWTSLDRHTVGEGSFPGCPHSPLLVGAGRRNIKIFPIFAPNAGTAGAVVARFYRIRVSG